MYTIMENDPTPTSLCVELSGELEIFVIASLSFIENTANNGDYANMNLTITFDSASSDSRCFPLVISEDGLLENDELFSISLSSADSKVDVENGSAQVTVLDSSELEVGFESALGIVTEGEVFMACVNITAGQLAEQFTLILSVQSLSGQGMYVSISACPYISACILIEALSTLHLTPHPCISYSPFFPSTSILLFPYCLCVVQLEFDIVNISGLILGITNEVLVFNNTNQAGQLCSSVMTVDDSVVELSGLFTVQLTPDEENARIIIQPAELAVTVEDDDSEFVDVDAPVVRPCIGS
jgi:hypothetical protein